MCVERDIHDTRTRAERAIRDAHTCVQRVCLTLRARACVCARDAGVVESEPFINFLLHNHFITEKFKKKKSGDVNDEAKFSLFILLHKRAKPILPPGRANSKPFPSARVEPLAQ